MLLEVREQDSDTVHLHAVVRGQDRRLHVATVRRVQGGWLVVAGICVGWVGLEGRFVTREDAVAHVQREAGSREVWP